MQGTVAPEEPWSDDTDGTLHLLLQMYSRDRMMAGRGEGGRPEARTSRALHRALRHWGSIPGAPGSPFCSVGRDAAQWGGVWGGRSWPESEEPQKEARWGWGKNMGRPEAETQGRERGPESGGSWGGERGRRQRKGAGRGQKAVTAGDRQPRLGVRMSDTWVGKVSLCTSKAHGGRGMCPLHVGRVALQACVGCLHGDI